MANSRRDPGPRGHLGRGLSTARREWVGGRYAAPVHVTGEATPYPTIPWSEVVSLRNRLIEDDLPTLVRDLSGDPGLRDSQQEYGPSEHSTSKQGTFREKELS